jgi:hypothetical protein
MKSQAPAISQPEPTAGPCSRAILQIGPGAEHRALGIEQHHPHQIAGGALAQQGAGGEQVLTHWAIQGIALGWPVEAEAGDAAAGGIVRPVSGLRLQPQPQRGKPGSDFVKMF